METAVLGDYSTRLQILLAFHCHLVLCKESRCKDDLVNKMWNIYNYYKQFLQSVEASLKTQRSPIEKEVKDYVKIARWNDINYWQVKASVEKAHRILHKQTKKFKKILMT